MSFNIRSTPTEPEPPSGVTPALGRSRRVVLLVEDEEDVRRVTRSYLERSGYEVLEAGGSASAMRAIDNDQVDVVVLDLGLVGEDGLDFLRAVRRKSDVPVLVVTARGEEADRVVGLELGADDYVVKPFSLRELTARIAAVLRRRLPERPLEVLRFGTLTIDADAHQVSVGDRRVELTRIEFGLLLFLARSPRRTFSYEQILAAVWESSVAFQGRSTVSEHVHRLRHKLGDDGGPCISTVRGVGYRFDP